MSENDRRREPSRFCYGCGRENPRGLALRFELDGGVASATFVGHPDHQGYPGHLHGGVVAAVLDEAMGWAAYAQGAFAMTAKMSVRFRRPVPLGRPLTVTAQAVRQRGRAIEMRAELRDAAGQVLAEADGLFMKVTGRTAEYLRREYEQARI
ncbi:MAG TPA: PaaI family thioesterase [Dehalococcoidia bacterium]|jgi:uncharacterized protein (TIGR00369 family)|nr:PaaI family thioesterase [Dehalococcoidia bacterium]